MKQQKKWQVWTPLLFALVMIAGMAIGYKLRENTNTPTSFFKLKKPTPLQEVLELISMKYVEDINTDTLADVAIAEMLNKLDPHSVYIPPVELDEVNEDLQGNFQGIGVEFHIFNDTVNIISVLPKGPSDKAGLQVGDQFLKVDDSTVAGNHITSAKIKSLLRGPGSSKVKITIQRGKERKMLTIERGSIPVFSVDASYMVDDKTGYIRINRFSETTYEEFMKAMETLNAKKMQSLILDLRGNGGGILQEAVDIADEFIDDEKLIVYTQGHNSPKIEYHCKRPGLFEKGKLILLTDEGSASASEVLVGALQDWDRATVIGRRTFGKGLVQEQYDLSDGSALRLTVAKYYTPLGRSIQKAYKGNNAYDSEIMDRYHHGEMLNADSNKVQNGKVFKTPSGKSLYGGGGIMPDVFVAFDTSAFSAALSALYSSTTMSNFVFHYYMDNKKALQQYKDPKDFATRFTTGDSWWNELVSFTSKDSLRVSSFSVKEKALTMKQAKALLARQIWRNEGFFEVLNSEDPTVKKALEFINKP